MTTPGASLTIFGPATLPGGAAGRRDLASSLIVAVWVAVTASQVARSLGGPKEYTPITEGPEPILPWVDRIETFCDALVLLACAATVVAGWHRGVRPRQWWLLAVLMAPWTVLVVRQVVGGGAIGPGVLPYAALVFTFWLVRPRFGAVVVLGYLTAASAVLAIALALVVPEAGRYIGGAGYLAEKPIGPWGILAGFLPTGNNMGRLLLVGLPSVLTIPRGAHRAAAVLVTVVALGWTASRTSAAGAVLLVVALVALRWAARRGPRTSTWAAGVGLGSIVTVMVLLPFVVSAPAQFNHRAGYWIVLLDQWRASPVVGEGIDYFDRIATGSANLGGYAFHAHNLTVQVLITGGLLVAVAVAGVLGLAVHRAVRSAADGDEWPALFLVAVLTAAVLEVPLSFADDVKANLPGLLPLLVLLLAPRPDPEADVEPGGGTMATAVAEV